MKKIIYFFTVLFLLSSCSNQLLVSQTDIQPHYITVKQLISLENGMSKQAVAKTLNVPPFEVYHSLENGCEVYGYIYDLKYQKVNQKEVDSKNGLNGGSAYFKKEYKDPLVRLYFKNNKLVDLITDTGEEFVALFGKPLELELMCSSESIKGCMDSGALNFNEQALIDDNSCEYCPCDFVENPNYDDKCANSQKCISIKEIEKEKAQEFDDKLKLLEKISKISDSCEFCDLIDRIASPYILKIDDNNTSINTTVQPKNTESVSKNIINSIIPPRIDNSRLSLRSPKSKRSSKPAFNMPSKEPVKQQRSLWKRTRLYLGVFTLGAILL